MKMETLQSHFQERKANCSISFHKKLKLFYFIYLFILMAQS